MIISERFFFIELLFIIYLFDVRKLIEKFRVIESSEQSFHENVDYLHSFSFPNKNRVKAEPNKNSISR